MPPFPFRFIADLLEKLEAVENRQRGPRPRTTSDKNAALKRIVQRWVSLHRAALDAPSTDLVAILSTLFPERRPDRVYNIQHPRLWRLVGRALSFNARKQEALARYRVPGNGDLATCLQHILKETDADPRPTLPGNPGPLSVGEIDAVLHAIASKCQFSRRYVLKADSADDAADLLKIIFLRAHAIDAKWLVRLILKDFSPVRLDEYHVLRSLHFLMPDLLRFQNEFFVVAKLLRGPLKSIPSNPNASSIPFYRAKAEEKIGPVVGVKIGRQDFCKAWSFKNCLDMVGAGIWSVEQKYDGEYCEVHIDLTKCLNDRIRIFSKSGKDSTTDRQALHATIQRSLSLDESDCKIKKQSILVGEMVVYCDKTERILGFHKIRKHIPRSGRFLGTRNDSQPQPHEKLMIIFFDVLLIDDDITMTRPYAVRRDRLHSLVKSIPGRARTSQRTCIDFSKKEAAQQLLEHFSKALFLRHEGLILKPVNAPYFSLQGNDSGTYPRFSIKLKRDYMKEMGGDRDIADMNVVGASYDAQLAAKSRVPHLRFTSFHIAGLINKTEVLRFGDKPKFRVIDVITLDHCIQPRDLRLLNIEGARRAIPYHGQTDMEHMTLILGPKSLSSMTTIFREPFVAEILGSGYEKQFNDSLFVLRHPRIQKLHFDRTWTDTVSVDELQKLAEEARQVPDMTCQEVDDIFMRVNCYVKTLRKRVSQSKSSLQTTPRSLYETPSPAAKSSSQTSCSLIQPSTPLAVGVSKRMQQSLQAAETIVLARNSHKYVFGPKPNSLLSRPLRSDNVQSKQQSLNVHGKTPILPAWFDHAKTALLGGYFGQHCPSCTSTTGPRSIAARHSPKRILSLDLPSADHIKRGLPCDSQGRASSTPKRLRIDSNKNNANSSVVSHSTPDLETGTPAEASSGVLVSTVAADTLISGIENHVITSQMDLPTDSSNSIIKAQLTSMLNLSTKTLDDLDTVGESIRRARESLGEMMYLAQSLKGQRKC